MIACPDVTVVRKVMIVSVLVVAVSVDLAEQRIVCAEVEEEMVKVQVIR